MAPSWRAGWNSGQAPIPSATLWTMRCVLAPLVLVLLSTAATLACAGSQAPAEQAATTTSLPPSEVKPMISKSGHDVTPLTQERIDELGKGLSPEEAQVLLAKGTERPF